MKSLDRVEEELNRQLETLTRKDIIAQPCNDTVILILAENMKQACDAANLIAAEHLELMVEQPLNCWFRSRTPGLSYVHYTPEPVGDYFAGPNHILPTGGTARFYSPVSVDTFTKASSLIYYSRQGIKDDVDQIMKLAMVEGLGAHANSLRVRKED